MTKSLQNWIEQAVLVQDACNLSGVVHAFSRFMADCCANGLDTDARNRHPVSQLFADKIASLTGTQFSPCTEAYLWCHDAKEGRITATWDDLDGSGVNSPR